MPVSHWVCRCPPCFVGLVLPNLVPSCFQGHLGQCFCTASVLWTSKPKQSTRGGHSPTCSWLDRDPHSLCRSRFRFRHFAPRRFDDQVSTSREVQMDFRWINCQKFSSHCPPAPHGLTRPVCPFLGGGIDAASVAVGERRLVRPWRALTPVWEEFFGWHGSHRAQV